MWLLCTREERSMTTNTPLHPNLISLPPEKLALLKGPTEAEIEEALRRGREESKASRRVSVYRPPRFR